MQIGQGESLKTKILKTNFNFYIQTAESSRQIFCFLNN